MNVVVDLVSREPLASVTVRRIAEATGCSLGQIHHHFSSADTLRAEAVLAVWNRLEPQLVLALQQLAPRPRLLAVLSGAASSLPPEIAALMDVAERLWKEAWDIRKELPVREAICFGFGKMRAEVLATLAEGISAGSFPPDLPVDEVADRLMAASQGYDLLSETRIPRLEQDKRIFMEGVFGKEGL